MATHSSVLAWRIPGMGSLVGCRLWGRTESDTTEAMQQQQQQELRTCRLCERFPKCSVNLCYSLTRPPQSREMNSTSEKKASFFRFFRTLWLIYFFSISNKGSHWPKAYLYVHNWKKNKNTSANCVLNADLSIWYIISLSQKCMKPHLWLLLSGGVRRVSENLFARLSSSAWLE